MFHWKLDWTTYPIDIGEKSKFLFIGLLESPQKRALAHIKMRNGNSLKSKHNSSHQIAGPIQCYNFKIHNFSAAWIFGTLYTTWEDKQLKTNGICLLEFLFLANGESQKSRIYIIKKLSSIQKGITKTSN